MVTKEGNTKGVPCIFLEQISQQIDTLILNLDIKLLIYCDHQGYHPSPIWTLWPHSPHHTLDQNQLFLDYHVIDNGSLIIIELEIAIYVTAFALKYLS